MTPLHRPCSWWMRSRSSWTMAARPATAPTSGRMMVIRLVSSCCGTLRSTEVVAKPISEALLATAFGLAAAIPAVVAYNYFVTRIRVLDSEMTNFSNDFLNIVRRHFFS